MLRNKPQVVNKPCTHDILPTYMFLREIALQGFKTFAKKTTLVFFDTTSRATPPVTAIVGPNGSGKSNIADAIRWVLGEQSMRVLRGKSSEDIIFSGSTSKARSGFAEVSLTFGDAEAATSLKTAELVITRRVYRSGESEYLVNHLPAKLQDIRLLLAEAQVGERSYSVISQGMIDHILVASPEERKLFFDDATGVRHLQLKRRESALKLQKSEANTAELERLLLEIEPHVRSLKRQLARLNEREHIEKTLLELENRYFRIEWGTVMRAIMQEKKDIALQEERCAKARAHTKALEEELVSIEQSYTEPGGERNIEHLQQLLKQARSVFQKQRDEQFEIQKKMEISQVRAVSTWAPLPLPKIIEHIKQIEQTHLQTIETLEHSSHPPEDLKNTLKKTLERLRHLLSKLERPNPDRIKPDPEFVRALAQKRTLVQEAEVAMKKAEEAIHALTQSEQEAKQEFFEKQRLLRAQEQEAKQYEEQRNAARIRLARLEERLHLIERDMSTRLTQEDIVHIQQTPIHARNETTQGLPEEIARHRKTLEHIGGIDPDIRTEYEALQERYTTLEAQHKDLHEASLDLQRIIRGLDTDIHEQSTVLFEQIRTEFRSFFRILFGGGTCDLLPYKQEPSLQEDGTPIPTKHADQIIGIEIQATPPGKRLKSLNLLSGGERALTSIALISAIATVNPGPFLVLDEVDAALDEANTVRFAELLRTLKRLTQCILITHNRATMEEADALYGVTMNEDGISELLSVKLEDMKQTSTSRR